MNEQDNSQHGDGQAAAEEDFFREEAGDQDPMGIRERVSERESKRRTRALVFLVVVLLLGMVLIYWLYEDLFYFCRSAAPTELGLSYEVEPVALAHNDFVRIEGIARDMCIRAEIYSRRVRFLYFLGPGMSKHILIESEAEEDEQCLGAEDRFFNGRLLDLARTDKYNSVIEYYRSHFPAAPREGPLYLLREGEQPRSSWWYPLIFLVVLVLWIINARTLVRLHTRREMASEHGGSG
jgi:hypothetical protein